MYYVRSSNGLLVTSYITQHWQQEKLVKTKEDLEKLRSLVIVPTQQIGAEYESITENERAAIPSLDELRQLNLNLIADVFPAKQRAHVSRLKTSAIWVPYKGKLHCNLQLSGFELFTMKYYKVFFLPSMLECKRQPSQEEKGNCVLEMNYDGLTIQGINAIWTSPYHIFRVESIENKDDLVHVQLISEPEISNSEIRESLGGMIHSLTRKGSMPLDRDVTSSQLIHFSNIFRL